MKQDPTLYELADRLYKGRSIFSHAGDILSALDPVRYEIKEMTPDSRKGDAARIASDWRRVGAYIADAMGRIMNERKD